MPVRILTSGRGSSGESGFKASAEPATSIQKSICLDSIVSQSNSTDPFWILFQQYRPKDGVIGRQLVDS